MLETDFLTILPGAFANAFQLSNLFGAAVGILVGVTLGAMPGLSGTMAIALMIPLTFHWSPLFSVAILMGCWKGSVYGGSISGILLNTPGTPEAAPTALDGYPLAQQGKAYKALVLALVASVIGALISDILLLVAAPPISQVAIRFGPVELTSLVAFALVIVAGTGSDSMLKGLIATGLGLFLAAVGLDPVDAQRRLTFSVLELDQGFELMAMMIGLLVLSEVFIQIRETLSEKNGKARVPVSIKRVGLTLAELKYCSGVIFKSSLIGSFCGALPGVGSITAAFLGYDHAKLSSKTPEKFGKGELKGVAAPEAANNAVCGTALIPMVTLGIPGSLSVAIIMGAFMIHGLAPGPMLMVDEPVFVYSLFVLLVVSDIFLLLIAWPLLPLAAMIVRIPVHYLLPVIVAFCFFGAYSTHQSLFDVQIMILFGILGFFLKLFGISAATLLIAYILGPMLEANLRLGLTLSHGDATAFFTRPISGAFLFLALITAIWIIWRQLNSGRKNTVDDPPAKAG